MITTRSGENRIWKILKGKEINLEILLACSVASILGTISPQIKIIIVIIIVAYVTASGMSGNSLKANTVVKDDAAMLT